MVHRYLATGVGVMILTLAVGCWLERRRLARLRDAPGVPVASAKNANASLWWAGMTLGWVCLQGAFGGLTVTMKLFPVIVTLHLLGGMVLLALLKAQATRHEQVYGGSTPVSLTAGARRLVLFAFALLWLQIALGGWVSTNYAVLACSSFPACQGSFWPAMNFSEGFTLWRELGAGADGVNITFQALTAIHYVHRLAAYAVFAALLAVVVRLHRVPTLCAQARWLLGLAVLQAATGLANVLLGWPLLAAVMHTGGAAALVIVLTGIVFSSRGEERRASAPAASKLGATRLSA